MPLIPTPTPVHRTRTIREWKGRLNADPGPNNTYEVVVTYEEFDADGETVLTSRESRAYVPDTWTMDEVKNLGNAMRDVLEQRLDAEFNQG